MLLMDFSKLFFFQLKPKNIFNKVIQHVENDLGDFSLDDLVAVKLISEIYQETKFTKKLSFADLK